MRQELDQITVNGVKYVREDLWKAATNTTGLLAVIVAAGIGGIHFGYLKSRTGQEVTLLNARRIQYWSGAASITEMAIKGVSNPDECRFTAPVNEITLLLAIEIIPVTSIAFKNLTEVPVWSR